MSGVKKQLPESKLDDPDLQAVPAAMERAVQRAHWDAHQHGTGVLVVENGEMVEVDPDPALYETYRTRMLRSRQRRGASSLGRRYQATTDRPPLTRRDDAR